MRREGYELSISKPHVIMRKDKETGELLEPIEYLVVDVPEKNMGGVMELVGNRKGELVRMDNRDGQVHLEFTIPARGLIGLRTRMLTATQGHGDHAPQLPRVRRRPRRRPRPRQRRDDQHAPAATPTRSR